LLTVVFVTQVINMSLSLVSHLLVPAILCNDWIALQNYWYERCRVGLFKLWRF